MKKLETVLILLFLILFFSNSSLVADSSSQILVFWFDQLVPSMFLCILIIQMLSTTSFFSQLSKPFRFLCPLLHLDEESLGFVFSCLLIGAPSSTLLINQVTKDKHITEPMGLRLLNCVSVSTVSFLIMSAGTVMLKSQMLGIVLWIIQLVVSLLLLWMTRSTPIIMKRQISQKKHSLKSALFQTGTTLFLIGGYLLMFQTLSRLFSQFLPEQMQFWIQILSEFSYGCNMIAERFDSYLAFVLMSALCGFNGFCVQFQSLSMSDLKIPVQRYFTFRIIQACLCFLIASAVFPLLLG